MTCNQVIVLMDTRRGFSPGIHAGTLGGDLLVLKKMSLIEEDLTPEAFPFKTTERGERVCESILKTATKVNF